MLKQKNLIFVGAPGAGKGTFSALLLERHPMAHISTGDILRDEVKRDTELGREAAKLMKEGKLVPDEVIAGMVRERLAQPDCDNGFILDGFPRTIRQAELLEEALSSLGRKLDRVVYFKVDDDVILKRLTARLNCRKCGKIYNKLFMPPKVSGKSAPRCSSTPSCSSGRTTRSRPRSRASRSSTGRPARLSIITGSRG